MLFRKQGYKKYAVINKCNTHLKSVDKNREKMQKIQ